MTITGVVQSIIYSNESNGYTIASFYPEIDNLEEEHTIEQIHFLQEGEITIVGYLPFIHEGDNLSVTGKIVRHPDYGEQLKVETFEKIMPKTLDALEMYLKFYRELGTMANSWILTKVWNKCIKCSRNL